MSVFLLLTSLSFLDRSLTLPHPVGPVSPVSPVSLNSPQAARRPVEFQQAAGVEDLHFSPGHADVPVLEGQVDEWQLQGPVRTQGEEVCVYNPRQGVGVDPVCVALKEPSSLTWP